MFFQIDPVHVAGEMSVAKIDYRPGFAHLSGAAHDKGFAAGLVFPGYQLIGDKAMHKLN